MHLISPPLLDSISAAIEYIPTPAAVVADGGEFVLWNDAFCALLRIPSLAGYRYQDFAVDDPNPPNSIIQGSISNYKIRKQFCVHGSTVPIELTVRYFCDGPDCYSLMVAQDLTAEVRVRELKEFQERFHIALNNRDFILHYQPIIDLKTGKTYAHEALLRWKQPEGTLLYPDKFLPRLRALEWEPMICSLVLDMVCEHVAETASRTAINIEPLTLSESGFEAMLDAAIGKHRIRRNLLILEIVEAKELDLDGLQQRVQRLAMRYILSVDDFGTGYNSLSAIIRLGASLVKIDKSLSQDICKSPLNQLVVERLISLIHELGMQVIAEGIETESDADWFRAHGCDYGQGYLWGKPCPWVR